MRLLKNFVLMVIVTLFSNLYADQPLTDRKEVKLFINQLVKDDGFNRKQLIAILNEATFQPQIIESMERPYEKKPWDVYKNLFLTPERMHEGLKFWQMNKKTLDWAQKKFSVPAEVIVAIIGVETLYGKKQGNYRVLDALTTLAFNYPKRSDFFTKELREYLLMCREHHVSPAQYMGSYAGAMGKPQFMPSSYRFYAVKVKGIGKPDLMNEDRDVIGSVANYMHLHGWKMNQAVAQKATINVAKYRGIITNSKTPNYTVKHLIAAGVQPIPSAAKGLHRAGLIELDTNNGQEFWIAYHNFYVITRYNTSPQYALVVYLLAQQLHRHLQAIDRGHNRVYG